MRRFHHRALAAAIAGMLALTAAACNDDALEIDDPDSPEAAPEDDTETDDTGTDDAEGEAAGHRRTSPASSRPRPTSSTRPRRKPASMAST
jgi:hypothetical protein